MQGCNLCLWYGHRRLLLTRRIMCMIVNCTFLTLSFFPEHKPVRLREMMNWLQCIYMCIQWMMKQLKNSTTRQIPPIAIAFNYIDSPTWEPKNIPMIEIIKKQDKKKVLNQLLQHFRSFLVHTCIIPELYRLSSQINISPEIWFAYLKCALCTLKKMKEGTKSCLLHPKLQS